MDDRWYYAHDAHKIGPYTGRQLRDLALAGHILPADTVWKEGVERGVLASKVRHLFQSTQTEPPPAGVSVPAAPVPSSPQPPAGTPASVGLGAVVPPPLPPLTSDAKPTTAELRMAGSPVEPKPGEAVVPGESLPVTLPDDIQLRPEENAVVPLKQTSVPEPAVRKRRAVGKRGAVIIGQDGTHVKFKKKCTECGREDSSWSTVPIINGTMRVGFFCPKCRKRREVEIQGYQI